MTPPERYFHGEYGASRAYLLHKVFHLTLAMDTWMLMIGHAGRYGVTDFNVAHFGWLDAMLATPSAGFYIAVLVLTGLLSLGLVVVGPSRPAASALFVSFTFSWSMSMLDSYQHHYFVSLILACMIFFPAVEATTVHPRPPPPPESEKAKKRKQHEQERVRQAEGAGWYYALVVLGAVGLYLLVDHGERGWLAFFALCGTIGAATLLYRPRRASGDAARTRGFGLPLLCATVAILYTFTAIAKMDAQWVGGHTILQISTAAEVFAPLATYAEQLGMPAERFWALFATSVIPLELFVAVGYALAAVQDRVPHLALRLACVGAFVLAMMLHVGAEAMGLEIGWFSYYMMMLAVALLLPLPAVDRMVTALTWPGRWLSAQLADFGDEEGGSPASTALPVTAGAALMLGVVGYWANLPGAFAACVVAALGLLSTAGALGLRTHWARARQYAVAGGVGATCLWLALAASDVRWDFYRYLGGDLRRRGHLEAALEAYVEGERYAPAGQSRADKIRELKRRLGR